MTTSEPTTGEIVRALRFCTGEDSICGTACPAYSSEAGCRTVLMQNAADRPESQEREIEELKAEAIVNALEDAERIANLTARAEQAERERDAAIKFIRTSDWCAGCENMKNLHCDFMKECANPHDLYKLRGQPQEGEGL